MCTAASPISSSAMGLSATSRLKISEGVAEMIKKLLLKEIAGSFIGRLAYPLIAGPLMNLKRKMDYAEFGGAPLLGVNGVTMICHGRSSAKAIKNAIRRAKGMAEVRVHELIQRDIEESRSQSADGSGDHESLHCRDRLLCACQGADECGS